MKINKYLISALLIIASFFIGYVLGRHNQEVIVQPSTPVTIIKDSIIREEIVKENEVIKWKIKNVEERYDQEVSIILSNTDSANFVYFSDYIRQYQNFNRTTKGN
ncbi:MAG: hypothetical protein IJ880_15765 [Bacilli bacterium]|nr:hypothetical protein [Bacilli bacterium]